MARQFFSGKSLEQAVMAAARTFQLEPTEVQYKVREKKHGFINGRRRFVIEVDPDAPKKDVVEEATEASVASESLSLLEGVVPPSQRKTRKDRVSKGSKDDESTTEEEVSDATHSSADDETDVSSEDREETEGNLDDGDSVAADTDDEDGDDLEDDDFEEEDDIEHDDPQVAAFLRAGNKLIDVLDVELDVRVERRDDEFFVDFTGEEADLLTENDGKILQAIEQLLPRMVRGLAGQGLPCSIDCEGFKETRVRELKELALQAADDVRSEGDDVLLRPMNPADRRVVHLALADDPDVETESTGEGFMKRLRIVPAD